MVFPQFGSVRECVGGAHHMKFLIFSVYDDKAKTFLPPFFLLNNAVAVRAFGDCVNTPGHAWNMNPADYSLFRVGVWHSDTGVVEAEATFECLVLGLQCKRTIDDALPGGEHK